MEMTKEEALKEGYTLCGYPEREYQTLIKIADADEEDFKLGELCIAEKEGMKPTADAEGIREMIADMMESNWGNDTGDDTEEVYNTIMKLDFTATANLINDALKDKTSYTLTTIVLKAGGV
jgi:hypothetical protein